MEDRHPSGTNPPSVVPFSVRQPPAMYTTRYASMGYVVSFDRIPWSKKSPSVLFRSNWFKYDYDEGSDLKKKKLPIQSGIVIVFDPVGSEKHQR